jgi:transposase
VRVHGKPALKTMTRELRESERRNITVDRTVRENVWVQARVRVRRTLRTCGYPPDKQRRTQTVLQQAEVPS